MNTNYATLLTALAAEYCKRHGMPYRKPLHKPTSALYSLNDLCIKPQEWWEQKVLFLGSGEEDEASSQQRKVVPVAGIIIP